MPVSHYATLALIFKSLLGFMSLPTITAHQWQIGSGFGTRGSTLEACGWRDQRHKTRRSLVCPQSERHTVRRNLVEGHPCRSCIHYKHSVLVDKSNFVVRQFECDAESHTHCLDPSHGRKLSGAVEGESVPLSCVRDSSWPNVLSCESCPLAPSRSCEPQNDCKTPGTRQLVVFCE